MICAAGSTLEFKMAEARHYARPPITEAVLELRFEGALTDRDLARARDRFKSAYPTIEKVEQFEVQFKEDKVLPPKRTLSHFKMTARNAVDIVMFGRQTLGTVRLAPYENWENLRGSAQGNWETFEKVFGTRKRVTRIGARFINRIDVPEAVVKIRPFVELFRTHIALAPGVAEQIGAFSYAVTAFHKETGAKLGIQAGIVQPPALLEHVSFTFDIDAYWDSEIPQRIDEMWARADILRLAKNDIFEKTVTDELRVLFDEPSGSKPS
jgi:uncharacterized protein (TIGR04255 family)